MFSFFKKGKNVDEIIISLKIEKHKALDINVLGNALISLNNLVSEYLESNINAEVNLNLKNVEKGSDIFNFIVSVSQSLFSKNNIDYINSLFDLFKSLSTIKDKKVNEIEKEIHYTQKFLKDSKNVVNIGNCANVTINSNVTNNYITITKDILESYSSGIDTIENIKGYKEKSLVKKIYHKMLIEFYQTTNETKKDIKYKAFCYDICKKAIPTIIDSKEFKEIVLENPYNYQFLCDVEIYVNAKNEISNYRIFNFTDRILKE